MKRDDLYTHRRLPSARWVGAWRVLLLLTGVLMVGQVQAATPPGASEGLGADLVNPGHHEQPSWFKVSFLDLREDVAEARASGKRVLLYFYQDGCPYCKKLLEDNFGQREIAEKTRRHFDVIAIDMWGDREVTGMDGMATTEKRFAEKMRVMFTPTLVFLDEKGDQVLRINGYYAPHKFDIALDYVAGHLEGKESFRHYLEQRAPESAHGKLNTEPYFSPPPYRLDTLVTKGKPLLVLFEQRRCRPCDELHGDIFKRKLTRALLDKFTVVQFDMWGKTPLVAPDGHKTTAAAWARKLNIQYAPSLVFFNAKGKEVFRSEAYLKSFHIQSVLDYVASGAYLTQPSLQRFIQARADRLRAEGQHVDLMK